MLSTLLLLFILALSASAKGAGDVTITLRLIDSKSGKPLSKVPVTIESWDGPPREPATNPFPRGTVRTSTDKDGRISFSLRDPTPQFVGFLGLNAPAFRTCTPFVFSVTDAMANGTIAPFYEDKTGCGKLITQNRPSPKPGEIVVYQRVFSRRDWLRQEIP
jgi:hypothetical protein